MRLPSSFGTTLIGIVTASLVLSACSVQPRPVTPVGNQAQQGSQSPPPKIVGENLYFDEGGVIIRYGVKPDGTVDGPLERMEYEGTSATVSNWLTQSSSDGRMLLYLVVPNSWDMITSILLDEHGAFSGFGKPFAKRIDQWDVPFFHPDRNLAYSFVTDSNVDRIKIMTVNTSTGEFSNVASFAFPPPEPERPGCRHARQPSNLAFQRTGELLVWRTEAFWCATSHEFTVRAFAFNDDGDLVSTGEYRVADDGSQEPSAWPTYAVDGHLYLPSTRCGTFVFNFDIRSEEISLGACTAILEPYASRVHSRDGRFIYSVKNDGTFTRFRIGSDGQLTDRTQLPPGDSTGASFPRVQMGNMNVLYVLTATTLRVFRIDPDSGDLVQTATITGLRDSLAVAPVWQQE